MRRRALLLHVCLKQSARLEEKTHIPLLTYKAGLQLQLPKKSHTSKNT